MKVLIGSRCVRSEVGIIPENEALEICTPAVMAVDCSRGLAFDNIRGELERVMRILSDCNTGNSGDNRALMVKTEPAGTWQVLTGAALERGIVNLAKRISETKDGELYIALPNSAYVEIFIIEEV